MNIYPHYGVTSSSEPSSPPQRASDASDTPSAPDLQPTLSFTIIDGRFRDTDLCVPSSNTYDCVTSAPYDPPPTSPYADIKAVFLARDASPSSSKEVVQLAVCKPVVRKTKRAENFELNLH